MKFKKAVSIIAALCVFLCMNMVFATELVAPQSVSGSGRTVSTVKTLPQFITAVQDKHSIKLTKSIKIDEHITFNYSEVRLSIPKGVTLTINTGYIMTLAKTARIDVYGTLVLDGKIEAGVEELDRKIVAHYPGKIVNPENIGERINVTSRADVRTFQELVAATTDGVSDILIKKSFTVTEDIALPNNSKIVVGGNFEKKVVLSIAQEATLFLNGGYIKIPDCYALNVGGSITGRGYIDIAGLVSFKDVDKVDPRIEVYFYRYATNYAELKVAFNEADYNIAKKYHVVFNPPDDIVISENIAMYSNMWLECHGGKLSVSPGVTFKVKGVVDLYSDMQIAGTVTGNGVINMRDCELSIGGGGMISGAGTLNVWMGDPANVHPGENCEWELVTNPEDLFVDEPDYFEPEEEVVAEEQEIEYFEEEVE